jgi:hypothetical protein
VPGPRRSEGNETADKLQWELNVHLAGLNQQAASQQELPRRVTRTGSPYEDSNMQRVSYMDPQTKELGNYYE